MNKEIIKYDLTFFVLGATRKCAHTIFLKIKEKTVVTPNKV